MLASLLAAAVSALPVAPPPEAPFLQIAPTGTYNSRWSDVPPPARFYGNHVATVVFTDDIAARCGVVPPKGMEVLGCYFRDRNVMVLPQPCPAAPDNRFASIACHELGHANGWSGNHEE